MGHITDKPEGLDSGNDLDKLAETEGDQAYLTFGGWAKLMPAPVLHERRRYTVDVECTATGIKASEKGDRHVRSLSILRVAEVAGVVPPPRDEDENQGSLFEGGDPDAQDDADADETAAADAHHEAAVPAKATKKRSGGDEPTPAFDNVTQFKAPGSK